MADKPVCQQAPRWLTAKYGKTILAPLTGQDRRALGAFVHLLELYAVSDLVGQRHAEAAMRSTVLAMQPKCRTIARDSIASVLDWSSEAALWERIGGKQ